MPLRTSIVSHTLSKIMTIFLVLISLPLKFIYILYRNQEQTSPPGPPRLPLIGNLHQLATTTSALHIYLLQLSKKYNSPIIHMKLGHKPLIIVSSPKLAKEVLKTHDLAFCSRPQSLWMKKLTYNSSDIVFSPFNDYWREMRKITTIHFFSQRKIQSFRPIREDEISLTIARVSKLAASSHDPVVNFSEVAAALNTRLICRIAFGKKYEDDGHEMRRFEALVREFLGMTLAFFVSDYFPSLYCSIGWISSWDQRRSSIGRSRILIRSTGSSSTTILIGIGLRVKRWVMIMRRMTFLIY